ncbi:MAG: hypothetical protein J6R77_06095 [Clostridia bacterium]|nr:hypothetical protein [Clostridia bacterium]
MKKYLGSKLTAFGAFVAPLFLCAPLVFGIIVLCTEISGATIFLAFLGIGCSLVWGVYVKNKGAQLYSWGRFQSNGVEIISGFSKRNTMIYEKCKGCGIGFYTHGLLNSKAGTKIYFIYLSYDAFDESFRSNINLWEPFQGRIKVQFSKKLYEYLLSVLPKKQSQMLCRDYERYLEKR